MPETETEKEPELVGERVKVAYSEGSDLRTLIGYVERSSQPGFVALRREDGRRFWIPVGNIFWVASVGVGEASR